MVISIIVLLLALLLPALRQAREAARTAVCSSNLKQSFVGFEVYATDFDGRVPAYQQFGGSYQYWMKVLVSGYEVGLGAGLNSATYVEKPVSLCPSNNFYSNDLSIPRNVTNAWRLGYGYYNADIGGAGTFQSKVQFTPPNPYDNYLLLQQLYLVDRLPVTGTSGPPSTARVIALIDSYGGHPSYPTGHMNGRFTPHSNTSYQNGVHLLHLRGVANAAFYDGHVAALADEAIRHETWSQAEYFYDRDGFAYQLP